MVFLVSFRCSSVLQHSKDIQTWSIGYFKLPMSVNFCPGSLCRPCDRLATCSWCTFPFAWCQLELIPDITSFWGSCSGFRGFIKEGGKSRTFTYSVYLWKAKKKWYKQPLFKTKKKNERDYNRNTHLGIFRFSNLNLVESMLYWITWRPITYYIIHHKSKSFILLSLYWIFTLTSNTYITYFTKNIVHMVTEIYAGFQGKRSSQSAYW